MRKMSLIFVVILVLLTSACKVLQGEINGGIELGGVEYSTENVGGITIRTPIPHNDNSEKPTEKPIFTNAPTGEFEHIETEVQTKVPTPTLAPTYIATSTACPTPTQATVPEPTMEANAGVLSGLKICIDAGHQLKGNSEKEACAPWNDTLKAKCTSGTTGNYTGIEEYITNLEIALKIEKELTQYGADVLMIRSDHNVNISNKERAEMANDFSADITIRIHGNSCDSPSVEGVELFVRDIGDGSSEYKEKSDADYEKASEMIKYICQETGAKSRGVKRSDAYTGINWCENTCIIVECGFLSNEKEDRLLNSDDYQQKIAIAIRNYFVSTFG